MRLASVGMADCPQGHRCPPARQVCFRLRGVDAEEPDGLAGDGEGVAVGDGGGARKLGVDEGGEYQGQEGEDGERSTSHGGSFAGDVLG